MSAAKKTNEAWAEQQKLAYYEASQWVLMRRRFSKHRVARWMLYVVILLYVLCMNADFFSPYDKSRIHGEWVNMPPQLLHFGFVEGHRLPQLYVYPYERVRNPITLAERYYVDDETPIPIHFFVRGRSWKFLGLFKTSLHFFGVDPAPLATRTADGKPVLGTITDDPTVSGVKYDQVTLQNVDALSLNLRPGDLIRVYPLEAEAGSDDFDRYRISMIDRETGAIVLETGSPTEVVGLRRVEVYRERPASLLGTDPLGQDQVSRILYGGRISLLIGLTGVLLSFTLGITLGGISGYFAGKVDMLIQRLAEILMTVPKIPIWLAMASAIPKDWSGLQVYFAMTLILACMGWTGLCRVVRGKLLALREEDYARAATLAGASQRRVIFAHLVPNFVSHIIASITLSIPGMIGAETSLSFLGLGLRPPIVSWGVLLNETRNVEVIENQPWLLLPAGMVILAVLSFNFVGEGLRDAADPYST